MTRLFLILLFSSLLIACANELEKPDLKAYSSSSLPKPKLEKKALEAPSGIIPFVSKEGQFSILFPDAPQEHKHTTTAAIGEIHLTQYIYSKDDTQAWVASFSDYPKKMIRLANKKQLLKGIKYRVLEDLKAHTISEEKIKLERKYKGLSFVAHAEKKPLDILYKIFLVKNRVYQLSMYSSIGPFSPKDSADFFGSFQLLKDTTLVQ
ncbi:hypothetical protein [Aureispira anguillae]|uniref:Uncharacterized protein n=1 Tax=Aureispira anguillae TaxID=2864201 RepID=A0A915YLK9_9BACT|nr:hypothetical protein [Aureispira anguillae]BDS15464.1 hypothetical protein AsAng_0062480 [Aureispira anguillae]